MKKFILFAALTFCILLPTGCVGNSNKKPNSSEDSSVKDPVTDMDTHRFSADAQTSLEALREKMEKKYTVRYGLHRLF